MSSDGKIPRGLLVEGGDAIKDGNFPLFFNENSLLFSG